MRIDVRSRTIRLSPSFRSIIERRVPFALAPLSQPIDSVLVTVEQDTDARGAAIKRCRIEARGPGLGLVAADDVDPDAYAALHGALRCLRLHVARAA